MLKLAEIRIFSISAGARFMLKLLKMPSKAFSFSKEAGFLSFYLLKITSYKRGLRRHPDTVTHRPFPPLPDRARARVKVDHRRKVQRENAPLPSNHSQPIIYGCLQSLTLIGFQSFEIYEHRQERRHFIAQVQP